MRNNFKRHVVMRLYFFDRSRTFLTDGAKSNMADNVDLGEIESRESDDELLLQPSMTAEKQNSLAIKF